MPGQAAHQQGAVAHLVAQLSLGSPGFQSIAQVRERRKLWEYQELQTILRGSPIYVDSGFAAG